MKPWTHYFILWVRLAFGLHMLISGLNYYFDLIPMTVTTVSASAPFVTAMMDNGMYEVIKLVEIAVGLCLISGLAVPLALVIEVPVTVSIFYLNVVVDSRPRQIYTGFKELTFHVLMLLAYFQYYRGMLKLHAPPWPIWQRRSSRIQSNEGDAT